VFLAASILFMLAVIFIVAGILIINNLLYKYWKPIKIWSEDSWQFTPNPKFVEDNEQSKKAKEVKQ
jgi:hypothetical protein